MMFQFNMLATTLQGVLHKCILTFDPAKNAIQSDAPEGSDTF